MKKILAVMALITVVVFGVFAETTLTAGVSAYGVFENGYYLFGPAIKLFTKSGNTFNDLTVESPVAGSHVENFDDIQAFIEEFDIESAKVQFLKFIRASESFGLALNFLGQEGGPLSLTLGIGGAVTMDGWFGDSNNRIMTFKAGAGADLCLGINLAKPLSILVGISANYPLFGLRVITYNGDTETKSFSIDDSRIEAAAHVGVGLCF